VVLFHRGHEHWGRMAHLVDELDLPDFDVYAWDARGHGHSPGERGFSPSFGTSVRDVQTFVDHITAATAWPCRHAHRGAERRRGAGGHLGARLRAAGARPGRWLARPSRSSCTCPSPAPGLALMHKLRGHFVVNSYVKAAVPDPRPGAHRELPTDPLIARPIAVGVLLGLYEAAERVVQDAGRPSRCPGAAADLGRRLGGAHGPQHDFFDRLGSAVKTKTVLPGFFHDTLGERDRAGP
jgi:alpha-beta hydrolase superfamily lysophospholipase